MVVGWAPGGLVGLVGDGCVVGVFRVSGFWVAGLCVWCQVWWVVVFVVVMGLACCALSGFASGTVPVWFGDWK